jgi:hypothetical protein
MFIMKFGTNFGHFAWMKANKIETKTRLVLTKALFRTLHQFQHIFNENVDNLAELDDILQKLALHKAEAL